MLNEIKIKYFLMLSEYLNFSTAAKALHITQQALSKQIGQLEQELDCVLFTRVPRGVELTESGMVMQKTFYSMQRGMELAMVEIHNNERSNGSGPQHRLCIRAASWSVYQPAVPGICKRNRRADLVWSAGHV